MILCDEKVFYHNLLWGFQSIYLLDRWQNVKEYQDFKKFDSFWQVWLKLSKFDLCLLWKIFVNQEKNFHIFFV